MSRGDMIDIERMSDEGQWESYLKLHCLNVNKTQSDEYAAAGGEQATAHVTFRVRWNRFLPDIELDMPRYRILWRKATFDIQGYDDFQYAHISVDLMGVTYARS